MPKLPVLKPRKVIQILKKLGFVEIRQIGSHLHLWHNEKKLRVTVPVHTKDLKRKTLVSIIRQARLEISDFQS